MQLFRSGKYRNKARRVTEISDNNIKNKELKDKDNDLIRQLTNAAFMYEPHGLSENLSKKQRESLSKNKSLDFSSLDSES